MQPYDFSYSLVAPSGDNHTSLHWINPEVLYHQIAKEKKLRYTREEIEERARALHEAIWEYRKEIWFDGVPNDPTQMLDPAVAATLIGYSCDEVSSLGTHRTSEGNFEIAGLIDNRLKKIQISSLNPIEVRNFTAAHELGHAVLHTDTGLHRDRAMDGTINSSRNEFEFQADQFATAFLMPEKLIRTRFKGVFLTNLFSLNENTAFALGQDYSKFLNRIKSLRQISRILASAEHYNGRQIVSLAKQFKVSTEAMAIRLEELSLVQQP